MPAVDSDTSKVVNGEQTLSSCRHLVSVCIVTWTPLKCLNKVQARVQTQIRPMLASLHASGSMPGCGGHGRCIHAEA